MRRLLLLTGLFFTIPAHAESYVINQTFCDGQALMGKMIVEARHRGVSKNAMAHDLNEMRKRVPEGNFLWTMVPTGLKALDRLYAKPYAFSPKEAYVELHNECRERRGQVVSL